MEKGYSLGRTEVSCEGYSYPGTQIGKLMIFRRSLYPCRFLRSRIRSKQESGLFYLQSSLFEFFILLESIFMDNWILPFHFLSCSHILFRFYGWNE